MLHKKFFLFSAIFVLSMVAVLSFARSAKAVIADVTISADDAMVGDYSDYNFSFTTDVSTKTKTISIIFPGGYDLNDGDNGSLGDVADVICSAGCAWDGFISVGEGEDEGLYPVSSVVRLNSTTIKITLDSSIDLNGGLISFEINQGIRNPYSVDDQEICVKTGVDTTPACDTVTTTPDEGSFGDYGYINLSVDDSTITADGLATFTVHAYDQYDNDLGDVSGDASFDISEGAGGSFTDNVYNPQWVGEWLVTANYGGHSDSVWIDVSAGATDSLHVEYDNDSYYADDVGSDDVYPGGSIHVYSVYRDQHGNFVSNPAVDWALINKTGGIVDGDLVADVDNKGALFTGHVVGGADIEADDSEVTETASIDVITNDEDYDYITLTVNDSTITADETATFTVEAFDSYDNSLGDVTTESTFTISEGASGSFTDNVYNPDNAGEWTIEANYNGLTDTTGLTVSPGTADYIIVTPDNTTISADDTQTFHAEAYDSHGNDIDEVTDDTTFSISMGAGGSFTDNVYTAEVSGEWTVTGEYGELSDSVSLDVDPGDPSYIVLSPDSDTISADDSEEFTVDAYDADENFIGDVTDDSDISIEGGAGGDWDDNVYYAEVPGEWTVSADYGELSDTTTLGVTLGAIDHFTVTDAVDPVAAGAGSLFTVNAYDSDNNLKTDYTGTVNFSSSDEEAGIYPTSYAFQVGDHGSATFSGENGVIFYTAGEQSLTATDSEDEDATGTQSAITVRHAALHHYTVETSKTTLAMNENFTMTVTAEDEYGNVMSSDNGATADTSHFVIDMDPVTAGNITNTYTFVSEDEGTKTFTGQNFTAEGEGIVITATKFGDAGITGDSDEITVAGVLAAPDTDVEEGTYYETQSVTLSATDSTSIHYTVNGTTPTCSTGSTTFPISVATTKTIKAIACYTGGESAVATFAYTISPASAPTASPVAGTYTSNQSITLSGGAGVSSMRYNSGSSPANPTCGSGTVYSSAISVTATTTIKAIACYPGSVSSSVSTFTFTIHKSSGGGGGGGSSSGSSVVTPPVASPTTPDTGCVAGNLFSSTTGKACGALPPSQNTPTNSDSSGQCSADLILTQNLRAPSKNGEFNSYTGGIVTEAAILQTHMQRLGFNPGPIDGIIGPLTDGAIKRMQAFLGTIQDGLVGPITRGLINHSCGSAGLHQ